MLVAIVPYRMCYAVLLRNCALLRDYIQQRLPHPNDMMYMLVSLCEHASMCVVAWLGFPFVPIDRDYITYSMHIIMAALWSDTHKHKATTKHISFSWSVFIPSLFLFSVADFQLNGEKNISYDKRVLSREQTRYICVYLIQSNEELNVRKARKTIDHFASCILTLKFIH